MGVKAEFLTFIGTIVAALWTSLLITTKSTALMLTFIIGATIYLLIRKEERNELLKRRKCAKST